MLLFLDLLLGPFWRRVRFLEDLTIG